MAINITAVHLLAALGSDSGGGVGKRRAAEAGEQSAGRGSNAGSWYYDGTYLYIHASDGSNVATNGKTYSYVTASSPSYTTWDNGKSWLIFDSLDQAETYNTSSATLGGLYLTGSNTIVRNLSAHDTFRHPFCVYTGATNNVVTNITAYNSYGTSPLCIYGAGTTGTWCRIRRFTTTRICATPTCSRAACGAWSWRTADRPNNTVDSCLIYSTAGPFRSNTFNGHGYGVLVGDSATSLTVSHSLIYGTFEWGVDVGSGGIRA